MAIFKCKRCGGDLSVTEGMTVCECEYCGTNQTVPALDGEKKINLFTRANHLRFNNDFDKAAGIYESIISEFPQEAEAYWGLCLCKYGIEYVDDPATGKKIPTCHRTSYESIFDDSNFEQAQDYADGTARRIYRDEAKEIDRLQKAIIDIAKNEEPYDIFICYKETAEDGQRTKDSVLAQDMYDALTEKGYKVFFARITLEDKLGQEYEPYIFSALSSAKIMLAVGTDFEYFNAVWVRNEWSRFLDMMKADKSKVLIPCYCDIDAYDMPKEFKNLQGQDMGKVGFMQDLLRGIGKILKPAESNNSSANMFSGEDVKSMISEAVSAAVASQKPAVRPFNPADYPDFEWEGRTIKKLISKELTDIEIPLGTIAIADYAFGSECNAKSIIIPDSVTSIGVNAFSLANNLKNIYTSENNSCFSSIDGVLFNKDMTSIIRFPKGREKDTYVIPDSVTSIGKCAFDGCKSLTNIAIPNSVTSIGGSAFCACKSFASITIPNSVTSIGGNAFNACESLASITIPDSVTSISVDTFNGCKSLTNITIPNSVTSIGEHAFQDCKSLTSITIPDSVTSIGVQAFKDCKSLASITIPDSVTSIGGWAFLRCTALTSITIPDSVTSIGHRAFDDCESLTNINASDRILEMMEDVGKKFLEKKKEEQRLEQEMMRERQREAWRSQGVCQHCGGELKGLFTKKCVNCGKPKDY